MVCCLKAASHNQNQYCLMTLIINMALRHSPSGTILLETFKISITKLQIKHLKSQPHLPGDNGLRLKFWVRGLSIHLLCYSHGPAVTWGLAEWLWRTGHTCCWGQCVYDVTVMCQQYLCLYRLAGIILGMGWTNERRRYNVTPSLIGPAHTQNDPWVWNISLVYPTVLIFGQQNWRYCSFALN